ncbi:hypothetical protein SAMN04488515_0963 [Cognatiyoonia koreensis]|uniref:Neutral zinc metallopeptidase n=1 Tax=Cognatiyoonia koreensis TaxID=364200 RepID=A0A1I0P207_9RHOB|nr:hypothetical protein [Cognatiyoonia koreensis]SEW08171.1 hypothetical protein SAMN04488515_0963 [Cognatiyoonia koreensis]
MKAMTLAVLIGLLASAASADDLDRIMQSANRAFDRMPVLQRVEMIAGRCGADQTVNPAVAYCTSQNTIFASDAAATRPETAYLLAHTLGHAVQVNHGVADVALATINANRADEEALRGDVTRQVECIAGVIYSRAGLPLVDLADWFSREPLTDSHWGRDPLSIGPKVSIGLDVRNQWFARGYRGQIADCATPRFGADLLIAAFKG